MTDEEKYLEVLKALGEVLAKQNSDLYYKDVQIENLKNKITQAEAEGSGEQKCKTK